MRGRKWEPEWDGVLMEMFPEERNEVIARKLGCGVRTLERHARRLGLEKSAAFKERSKEWSADGYRRYCEYMRITGQKLVRKGVYGKPFEKGHRFDGEIEAKRIKAIRDRAWDERVRIIRGMSRNTGWKMVDYCKGKVK